jgi:hypothetical protein
MVASITSLPLTIKYEVVTEIHTEPRTWMDSLDNMDMRFGTWSVRHVYQVGSLVTVSKEL